MSKRLTPSMQTALSQYKETGNLKGVHPNTIRALERRNLVERDGAGVSVRESAANPRNTRYVLRWADDEFGFDLTHDPGQPNYKFWDSAIRGKAEGLKLAGLFLKPLGSKTAAWVMGDAPKLVFENPDNQSVWNRWFTRHHGDTLRALEEGVNKGDAYLVLNPPDERGNLTVTLLPPHVVKPLVDEDDYSRQIGWKVVEVHPHPDNNMKRMRIVDEYTAERRIRKIYQQGKHISTEEYRNPLGRVPIIHIPNNRGADESFGHAEGEPLLEALYLYDEIFHHAAAGNKRQGRPTPVISRMGSQQNIEAFWQKFGKKETRDLDDGTTETVWVLEFDADRIMTLGGDATFSWESPGSFSADTVALLGLLFYLILQHTELPEFIWGNAIASSKASADAQMPAFIKFIQKKRGEAQAWLVELAMLVVAYHALYELDRQLDSMEEPSVQWSPLADGDDRLTLDAIKLGIEKNLLDDETALSLMPLDIDNPREVLDALKAELQAKQDEMDARSEQMILRMQEPPEDDMAGDDTDDEPAETSDVSEAYRPGIRISEQNHTGGMCAFMVPTVQAEVLHDAAVDAGIEEAIPVGEMHLTLVYFGDTTEIDVDRERLESVLLDFANTHLPLSGTVSGMGRFNASHRDGMNAVYASFASPDLPTFRQDLVEMFEDADIPFVNNHGFTPHITLGYIDADDETPNIQLDQIDIIFKTITLAWGDAILNFSLVGELEPA